MKQKKVEAVPHAPANRARKFERVYVKLPKAEKLKWFKMARVLQYENTSDFVRYAISLAEQRHFPDGVGK